MTVGKLHLSFTFLIYELGSVLPASQNSYGCKYQVKCVKAINPVPIPQLEDGICLLLFPSSTLLVLGGRLEVGRAGGTHTETSQEALEQGEDLVTA